MFRRTLPASIVLAIALTSASVFAQDPALDPIPTYTGKTFKLSRGDDSAANELDMDQQKAAWKPALSKGTIETSISIGTLNMATTLLQHDQIIYKYTTDATYWGDVKLSGKSAFAPTFRLGYAVSDWLGLESTVGVSFSEYTASITNTRKRSNEPQASVEVNPPLGEFDAEDRSLITMQGGLSAVVYPLSIKGGAGGRWHPFLTAGAGTMWYDMNSNFVAGAASGLDLNFGGGLRILADDRISVRFEVLMHRNDLEWDPAEYFAEFNEGTTRVPLAEFPVLPSGAVDERRVETFDSTAMNLLQWSIGVQGSF